MLDADLSTKTRSAARPRRRWILGGVDGGVARRRLALPVGAFCFALVLCSALAGCSTVVSGTPVASRREGAAIMMRHTESIGGGKSHARPTDKKGGHALST